MSTQGRIGKLLVPEARRILFEQHLESACPEHPRRLEEFHALAAVDTAHVAMLAERGILDPEGAQRLLGVIDELVRSDFEALERRPAPRGLYLSYEAWLIETLGEDIGGMLHAGRSRNDLNATIFLLQLRRPYGRLVQDTLRLAGALFRGASRYSRVVMPGYTHYQPAVPITYGHYLAGVAAALNRDLEALLHAGEGLTISPLGAGALGGTTLPIDPRRTADLLGFEAAVANSVDAVASRDIVLRILAAAAILGVLLSRIASNLLLWMSQEFELLRLPDELTGTSSMMPQKRNAFLLEHVQGRSAGALGAFTAASAGMRSTPFSNSIAVGTEAASHVWPALAATSEAATLLRLVVAGARPVRERMLERAREGATTATALAEEMVTGGTPFRTAHSRIGRVVREAEEEEHDPEEALRTEFHDLAESGVLDPEIAAARMKFGGGPGAGEGMLVDLRADWFEHARRLRRWRVRWSESASRLAQIRADALTCGALSTRPGSS
jgi:argininosuccinate lyase